jgi:hypothetical protein
MVSKNGKALPRLAVSYRGDRLLGTVCFAFLKDPDRNQIELVEARK